MQNTFKGKKTRLAHISWKHSTYRRLGLGKISLGRILGVVPTARLYYGAGTVTVFREGERKKRCGHYQNFKNHGNGIA